MSTEVTCIRAHFAARAQHRGFRCDVREWNPRCCARAAKWARGARGAIRGFRLEFPRFEANNPRAKDVW